MQTHIWSLIPVSCHQAERDHWVLIHVSCPGAKDCGIGGCKRDGETSGGVPIYKKDYICVEGQHNQTDEWTEEQHRLKGWMDGWINK